MHSSAGWGVNGLIRFGRLSAQAYFIYQSVVSSTRGSSEVMRVFCTLAGLDGLEEEYGLL